MRKPATEKEKHFLINFIMDNTAMISKGDHELASLHHADLVAATWIFTTKDHKDSHAFITGFLTNMNTLREAMDLRELPSDESFTEMMKRFEKDKKEAVAEIDDILKIIDVSQEQQSLVFAPSVAIYMLRKVNSTYTVLDMICICLTFVCHNNYENDTFDKIGLRFMDDINNASFVEHCNKLLANPNTILT